MRATTHPLPSHPSAASPSGGQDRPGVVARTPLVEHGLTLLALAAIAITAAGLAVMARAVSLAPHPTAVLITEADGTAVHLHRGAVQTWSVSGGVMQLAYTRDDIFTGGFQP